MAELYQIVYAIAIPFILLFGLFALYNTTLFDRFKKTSEKD
jgi:hypothetical protein